MKTLVAFALLCAVSVHAQTQSQPPATQPGVGVGQPQPFPTGGTQPFQPGVGQPFQPFQPGLGQPFQTGFPYAGQFPGAGQFGQPGAGQFGQPGAGQFGQPVEQLQPLYAIDGALGKRCVPGVAEYTAIVQNTADYDYSRDLTDCPQPQPYQRTLTAKDIKVYVVHQGGMPQAQCTFDRNLFVQISSNQPMAPGASFGRLFPCPIDGNLDPSALTAPTATGQPTFGAGGYNPYALNPYGQTGFQPNPYGGGNFGGFGGFPGFGAGRGAFGAGGAAIGASFPPRGPFSAKRK